MADREPVDFTVWRYLRDVYAAVPSDPAGLDLTIMKGAQSGASTFAMLCTLWLALRQRCQVAYFLPVARTAFAFSQNRFIRMARDNHAIHQLLGDPATPHQRRVVDEGSASVRRILESIVYFTFMGGKVSTEALPLDALVFDEIQAMLLADIERAEERVAASALRTIIRVSTANFAGADIAYFYERSDQRKWHTRCGCSDDVVLAECWDPRVGPLCIDSGNGTTPSVPREPFYVCPRCREILLDPQDGYFVAHRPAIPRVGFHWPQMVSPRQTAASILDKWQRRVDTGHFYNRILGLPYADPATQPVTEAQLIAAQNPELRWGPPAQSEVDGVYMGLDQMGGDLHVVIAARAGGKQRLVHLEIVQSDDPFRRAAELMALYRIRYCAVENLPNFNEAHRFAKAFPGRVFVVHYQDQADDLIAWGDRPGDSAATRLSEEEVKTRFTAAVDQYKTMSWALSRWVHGEVETPDARTLTQRLRTDQGERLVQVCCDPKEGLWLHLQRIALVTELPEGREDERKPRRAVRKVGIDPHFAYAWLLLQVAWARAHGTTTMLSVQDSADSAHTATSPTTTTADPHRAQLSEVFASLSSNTAEGASCGECVNFDPVRRFCNERRWLVQPQQPQCGAFVPEDDDTYDDEEDYGGDEW